MMEAIESIQKFLEEAKKSAGVSKATLRPILRRNINESWFSDTLAWLLDPEGSHGLGVAFAREFVRKVGKIRSKGENKYSHRKAHLKLGKSGSGTGATGFSLSNAGVFREFYLAKQLGKKGKRGTRYCDVVFLDLDSSDSLFLVIENKLFTTNHPGQLEEYFEAVEEKYGRAKIREYVYLTLNGDEPIQFEGDTPGKMKHWVRMSWVEDIGDILEKIEPGKRKDGFPAVKQFSEFLKWLKTMLNPSAEVKNSVEQIISGLVEATADCLLEELNRLGEGLGSAWGKERDLKNHTTLKYSKVKSPLHVELLPNFSITIQGKMRSKIKAKRGKAIFEKILVPFGSNSSQIFNLLDLAARDIYHLHLTQGEANRIRKKKFTKTVSPVKEQTRSLFDFVHQNCFSLQILFMLSKRITEAQKLELENENHSEGT
jgi:hypothetical protein